MMFLYRAETPGSIMVTLKPLLAFRRHVQTIELAITVRFAVVISAKKILKLEDITKRCRNMIRPIAPRLIGNAGMSGIEERNGTGSTGENNKQNDDQD